MTAPDWITDTVLIVDFGSQVTQLIARRIREIGVYCEIAPYPKADIAFARLNPRAIILSGGPASVFEAGAPRISDKILSCGLPILGICYGQQLLCNQLGGVVEPSMHREFGRAIIDITDDCPLFTDVWAKGSQQTVWMSHGTHVTTLPPGFRGVAKTNNAPFAIIVNDNIYGLQFHPEVVHTPEGSKLLTNFVLNIAGCRPDWTMQSFRNEAIAAIRNQVGDGQVICALSGGVDSSVVAALIHEAIGEQLTCVFIDNGLMRLNEGSQVVSLFRDHYNIKLIHRDASELFLSELSGVSDPEQKRKIIGRLFIEIFEQIAADIGGADFLAQGTLYPDVVESVSISGGAMIKSHHNVGGLPELMNMKLIEPLRELFKDEVRMLGRELGLPDSLINRHPFPGPGLAIRVPGEITFAALEILRKADAIFLEEIRKAGLYDKIWQAFAVLLPVRSVGVMGDGRTYEKVCALRAVSATDGMTATSFAFDHDFLCHVTTRIINEVRGINRVVYDLTSKPPGTIEWE